MKLSHAVFRVTLTALSFSCRDKAPPAQAASTDGVVRIGIAALGEGFKPADVRVKQGQNVELLFKRDTEDTCATDVVFNALSIKKDLPLGQTVAIKIPTGTRAEYTFTCGMGMHKSRVVVE